MISPCSCSGSISHVHRKCLREYVRVSGSKKCPVCLSAFPQDALKPEASVIPLTLCSLGIGLYQVILKGQIIPGLFVGVLSFAIQESNQVGLNWPFLRSLWQTLAVTSFSSNMSAGYFFLFIIECLFALVVFTYLEQHYPDVTHQPHQAPVVPNEGRLGQVPRGVLPHQAHARRGTGEIMRAMFAFARSKSHKIFNKPQARNVRMPHGFSGFRRRVFRSSRRPGAWTHG